jgi:hypothetical protein
MKLEYSGYKNPRYVDADNIGILIDLDVTSPWTKTIPFTAMADDPVEHGRKIHAEIIANQDAIPIEPYAAPELETTIGM